MRRSRVTFAAGLERDMTLNSLSERHRRRSLPARSILKREEEQGEQRDQPDAPVERQVMGPYCRCEKQNVLFVFIMYVHDFQ